jgi:hypothetical protein
MNAWIERLALEVVKDGVMPGGLTPLQHGLALGLAWSGLPGGDVLSEAQVNACLKAQLAGPLCWLDTDHVELRRRLVDAGWLARDGHGRAYERVAAAALPAGAQAAAAAVAGLDAARWVADLRAARAAQRAARRASWQQRRAGGATDAFGASGVPAAPAGLGASGASGVSGATGVSGAAGRGADAAA